MRDIGYITQEYPRLKDRPNTHTVYTSNLDRSRKLALINAIDEVSIVETTAERLNFIPGMTLQDINLEGAMIE